MKNNYFLLLVLLFGCQLLFAQVITETFDNEANNVTSFSEEGIVFNITSQQSYFRVQGGYPGTGWSGTANDNKYLDNSGYTSSTRGVQFTVTAANGAAINLKSMWLYISTSGLNLSPIGTITITGKLGNIEVFTGSRSNPFNPSATINNGFTFIDFANFAGQDNSNKVIDSYVITTDMGIGYISLDAVKYTCAPVAFTATTQTNVTCNGANNGTATVIPAANGTLSYNWAPGNPAGDGTATATGLPPGVWTCTVTNACGSTNTATFTITQPDAITATTSQTNVLCNGGATGNAGVTPTGGTGGYTYLWSNGGTGSSVTGLSAGSYTVTVRDANNCSITKNITITQPDALTATTTQTDVLCTGSATGSATILPAGGAGNYTYVWSPSGGSGSTASGLAAGAYTVTVRDANNCSITKNITIGQPANALSATTSQNNISCNGSATGSASVFANGGTGNYTYVWSPSGGTGATASNLPAGDYNVVVTDANNCSVTKYFTITQPIALTATIAQTNVLCYGNATGSATVTPSGGAGGYTYSWLPSGSTGAIASCLAAGTYFVTIRDANNCSIAQLVTITQPAAPLTATTSQTNSICYGDTGSATVTPGGGTGNYTYAWLPSGGNSATATGLTAGDYNVTITDGNGCSIVKYFSFTQPNPIAVTTSQTPVLCNGGTATATVTPVNGGSYTYLWSPSGGNTATANGLTAGNYNVVVSDANNCSVTQYFTITQPDALTATTTQTNVLCNGNATGSASVSALGGTGTYTYLWSDGSTGTAVTGLSAGEYSVIITDANNCALTKYFTITQPDAITATTYYDPIACYGGTTTATVAPSGGAGGYTYSWASWGRQGFISSTDTATNLPDGFYIITITDANNCSTDVYLRVEQPVAIEVTAVQTNVPCFGGTGSIALAPADSTTSYTYIWSTGATTSAISGLLPGDYNVTVTNAAGCSITQIYTITEPDPLTATQEQFGINCNNGVATARVTASGGSGWYTYQWLPYGGTDYIAFGLTAGEYSVIITDSNGCTITKYFSLTNPEPIAATTSQIEGTCLNGYTATATVEATGGTGTYTYSWYPYGGNAATSTGLYGGDFTVTITDSNYCSITKDFTITEPVYTNVFVTQTAATCNELGSATVTVEGGSGQYTYLWSNGSTQATATGLSPGYAMVTVTDVVTTCTDTREVYVRGPEECTATTVWDGTGWSNGVPGCVSYAVEINGNYNSTLNGPITACSLTVNSGNVVVTAGYTFTITGSVIVANGASLTFEDNAALLQTNSYNENSGAIKVVKNSNPLYRLDYTMWSSPVAGQQLLAFSPRTNAGRFYEYGYGFDETANNGQGANVEQYWIVNPESDFEAATGYLIRMPNTDYAPGYDAGTAPAVFEGNFSGLPNNGYITRQASVNGGRYTAIGNPYPSPLNLASFFNYNSYVIDAQSGIYFWRKRNNTSASSYATLTLAAYTANGPQYGGAEQAAYFTGDSNDWLLSQGQGFIVRTHAEAEYTQITFLNSMRRPAPAGGSQAFLRQSQSAVPRLWLNLTHANGAFSQTALAYINTATTGIDYGYDGQVFNDGGTALYSIAANVNLAVQARPTFTVNDVVPMGFVIAVAGQYTIAPDHFEGLFSQSQDIYLKDNLTGIIHDLKESSYTFTTEAGTFNTRFEIVYTNSVLATGSPEFNADNVMVYKEGSSIHINAGAATITEVVVYDIRGRKLYSKNTINAAETAITGLQADTQVLIIEVHTTKGTVSKRIVF